MGETYVDVDVDVHVDVDEDGDGDVSALPKSFSAFAIILPESCDCIRSDSGI